MGIYIRGVKAPESCSKCRLSGWSNYGQYYRCEICDRAVAKLASEYEGAKPAWCPIVDIPDHVNLINRDDLGIGKFTDTKHDYRLGWNDAIEAVMENAEVIIGAERTK